MARTGQTRPRKRPTRWTPKRAETFLAGLRQGHTVSHAARGAGFARQTVYEHRDVDAAFAASWSAAEAEGTESLEQEARRRAVEGTLRPVYQQGVLVGKIREYSDTLLIFLLKGRKPQTYRDHVKMEGTVAHGPVQVQLQPLDDPDRIAGILGILAGVGAVPAAAGAAGARPGDDPAADPVHPPRADR